MTEIKNVKVYGLEESIIRSGYPMRLGEPEMKTPTKDDLKRAKSLGGCKPNSGHDNFLKGIIVQFDLRYPQYLTPQLQRYSWIDIVSSQSKMHKLSSLNDIAENCNNYVWQETIDKINEEIKLYNEYSGDDKRESFHRIISNLPMGFELWMGISTNYLQLKTIYFQRKTHKLDDWRVITNFIETLPLFRELVLKEDFEF
jgi:hypothetical protein